jgi:hypothetical protein
MTVYVDEMRAKFGRMILCHMTADSDEELHAMAARIGMKREWHQKAGTYKSHYDVSLSKRALAIHFGAIEINRSQLGQMLKQRRLALAQEKENARRANEEVVSERTEST